MRRAPERTLPAESALPDVRSNPSRWGPHRRWVRGNRAGSVRAARAARDGGPRPCSGRKGSGAVSTQPAGSPMDLIPARDVPDAEASLETRLLRGDYRSTCR